MKQLILLSLEIGMPETQIIKAMRGMRKLRQKIPEDLSIVAGIHGYGSDPRELWEIPEVRTFAVKLVELGFIAYLDPMPTDLTGPSRPFTAIDIWLLSQGRLEPEVTVDMRELKEAMDAAQAKAESLLTT